MPKIRIIARGIYGATEEAAIGSIHTVSEIPVGWAELVEVLPEDEEAPQPEPEPEPVTEPEPAPAPQPEIAAPAWKKPGK